MWCDNATGAQICLKRYEWQHFLIQAELLRARSLRNPLQMCWFISNQVRPDFCVNNRTVFGILENN